MRRTRMLLKIRWWLHRFAGHRLAGAIRRLGGRKAANWLHDATLPPWSDHTWDIIGSRMERDREIKA